MRRLTSTLLVLGLLAACGGRPAAPSPSTTPLEAEASALAAAGDAPAGPAPGDADPPAARPEAAPAAVEVEEVAVRRRPGGDLVEERDAARLVALGGGLRGYAGRLAAKVRRSMGLTGSRRSVAAVGSLPSPAPPSVAASAPARSAPAGAAQEAPARPAAPAAAADESITNVQVAGVDEGGIVKAWGEFLVVLRRGRIFTVRLGDAPGGAAAVASMDVRPPRSSHEAWYDEMLVHAPTGTVVVIGFSYDHEATEIALFRISEDGTLARRGAHLLRSNDYYSSRNYASRLVGDTLVFYMPHYLVDMASDWPRASLPATRGLAGGTWRSIVQSSEVYRIGTERDQATLHSVVTCDLSDPRFRCRARGIVGGEGRTFFVSREAVYVWVMAAYPEWDDDGAEDEGTLDPSRRPAHLFRLPLDGSRPSALVVRGAPIDQLSFFEGPEDLWVLVRAEGGGDAMWAPELPAGALGLVRVPLSAFGREVRELAPAAYATLPAPGQGSVQNRFVGEYVLYGAGEGWGHRAASEQGQQLYLHRYEDGRTFVVTVPGGVDRIEALASDAVVVGSDGASLHFRAIALEASPRPAGAFVQQGASQGETRTHGFFYHPEGERRGVLGLPTVAAGRPGHEQLVHGSAEVLYLAVDQLAFAALGTLAAGREQPDDRCEVSCVDWYGNARPLFYRGRVFALLGYELVEGRIARGEIEELARTSMLGALRP